MGMPRRTMCTMPATPARRRSACLSAEPLERRRLLAAVVRGVVFDDADADGVRDGGESLPIWTPTIWADLDYNGTLDAGEPSTTQPFASSGYALTLPQGGTYVIRSTMPAGYVASVPATGWQRVTLTDGLATFRVDFGGYRTGRVAVSPFDDLDADGTRDGNENGATATLWADLDDDGLLDLNEPASASTGSTAAVLDLRPGTYRLRLLPLAGRVNTGAPNGIVHTIEAGLASFPLPVSFTPTRTATGVAFTDVDGDERFTPGDLPVAGATAFIDLNGNTLADAAEPKAFTDAQGRYAIVSAAIPNESTLRLRWPDGTPSSSALSFSLVSTSIDIGLLNAIRRVTNVAAGRLFVDLNGNGTYDANQTLIEPYAMGTSIYADTDGNGQRDAAEPATVTDAAGQFVLGVPSGTFAVRAISGAGYAVTGDSVGGVRTFANNIRVNLGLLAVTDSATTRTGVSVDGTVYLDANRNHRRDAGEAGFAGGGIAYVDRNANGRFDVGETSAAIGARGRYQLLDLPAADAGARLRVDAGAAWKDSLIGRNGGIVVPSSGRVYADTPVHARPDVGVATSFVDVNDHQAVRLTFTHDLGASLQAGDVLLQMYFNGAYRPTQALFTLQRGPLDPAGGSTATLRLAEPLPDGNYRLILPTGAVANMSLEASPSPTTIDFHILAADANRDRRVDFNDLLILAAHFNQTGRTFTQGNFDDSPDGRVDFNDLLILASRFNKAFETPAVDVPFAAAATSSPTVATRKRLSDALDVLR